MGMRVGELARRTGVGASTLRAWERRFHLLQPERSDAGHRVYEEADVERVEAVLRLLAEGLTLPTAISRAAGGGSGAIATGEAEALFYNQILEAVGHGIWVLREGQSRYVNTRMAELLRYSVDELVALPVNALFEPEDLPLVKERNERVRAGDRLHFTQRLRRGDGTTFLAEVNTTPLLTPTRRYDGAVALVEDISERHQTLADAQLRATLLDSIGQAVTAASPDGTLVYVNAAAERLFGWRAKDVIGRHSRDVFPTPVESTEQVARINSMLLGGRRYTGRFKMIRHDGTDFDAQLTTVPAIDNTGTHIGFVGVITDQTDQELQDRRQSIRERQSETLALLGAQALRDRSDPGDKTSILTEAVEATRRLLDADHAAVLDVVPDSDELQPRIASPSADRQTAVPSGSRSFAGYTALARKAILVEDARRDGRFDQHPTHTRRATISAIGAPVFGINGVHGVLLAESRTAKHFERGDVHFLQAMANIIGITLQK
jgi:PAS domain S-box-containing protein